MRLIPSLLVGTLCGAIVGGLIGYVPGWASVNNSYTGLGTFWRDCGPHLFVPVWLGAAVGLVSRLTGKSVSGMLILAFAGVCAGLLAPAAFLYSFGQPFTMSVGFMGIPYAREIVLGAGGAVAAFFWFFSVTKLLR